MTASVSRLAFLRRNRRITNQQYRSVTGSDSLTATRELTGLAAEGLIDKTSDRRWTVWVLAGAQDHEPQPRLEFADEATPQRRSDRSSSIRALLQVGPQSAKYLATELGITPEGVRQWLRRMEAAGEVEPTSEKRRSRHNKWRLSDTDGGIAGDDRPA